MTTEWISNLTSCSDQRQITVAVKGIGSGPPTSEKDSTHQQHQQTTPKRTELSRVSASSSWDSGFNEAPGDILLDVVSFTSSTSRPAFPVRMPSVVVSDCSEGSSADPVELVNGSYHHNDHPSPTPSSHSQSSSGQEMDNPDSQIWSWSASLRSSSSSSFLILPGQSFDDDLMSSGSLLAVRRLSDCSSSSSLATLDMEPCCACNGEDDESQHHRHHLPTLYGRPSPSFDDPSSPSALLADFSCSNGDVSVSHDDGTSTKKEDTALTLDGMDPASRSASAVKVSAWRKVRSAVQWSPFVQTFRKQRYPWVQLAGHQGNFKAGGERGTILKKLCPKEESCFQSLMKDPLRPFVPSYKGHVSADDGEKFLVLEDLLGDFSNPCVMDCKLGVRTYLEDELAKAKLKPKLRKDMFEKMLQVDPSAPTAEELKLGGVTKPRYMVWRETISSTASLGFRIEGIRKQDGSSSKDYKTIGTAQQILAVLSGFVQDHPNALSQYIERLDSLTSTLQASEFFASHELIGSSLLFVHDNSKANVWMIDFAKTHPLPSGVRIDHRSPWRVGNHEDGYLTGLTNLLRLLKQLQRGEDRKECP